MGTATGGPLKPIGICPLHEVGWRGMEESTRVEIFDGHNDAVQHVAGYRRGGRDFLTRSNDGHLDLPRAREGGLIGGLFAVSAMPEHAPEGDLTITKIGYEMRLAEPLDPAYARRQIGDQLDALSRLEARADGQIRRAVSVADIEAGRRDGVFVMVLHRPAVHRRGCANVTRQTGSSTRTRPSLATVLLNCTPPSWGSKDE
jgi:hypothetical protein